MLEVERLAAMGENVVVHEHMHSGKPSRDFRMMNERHETEWEKARNRARNTAMGAASAKGEKESESEEEGTSNGRGKGKGDGKDKGKEKTSFSLPRRSGRKGDRL